MLKNIFNFLFPHVCGFCGKIDKNSICSKCYVKIKPLIIANVLNFTDRYYNNLIYCFKYEGIIRKMILDYKFNDKSYLYNTFVKIILKSKKICGILKKYDIIIPVPIHKKKLRKRGYNQTELIARKIAKELSIKYSNKVLVKQVNTETQSLLSYFQRENNVIGAYTTKNNEIIYNQKVLLIDDIYTTGSTANECSKVLKKAGAKSIDVLVIAKD